MENVKTLFIVDDDEDDQLFLHEAINKLGISIDFYYANNGETALELLKSGTIPVPDYIFLDLNMPKLNGKECLLEIKKMSAYSRVPVIIYSTSSHQKDIQEIMLCGAAYFLTKPTRISELCDKLHQIFSREYIKTQKAEEKKM